MYLRQPISICRPAAPRGFLRLMALVSTFAALGLAPSVMAQYEVQDLGTLNGAPAAFVEAVNDHNQVVGTALTRRTGVPWHAFFVDADADRVQMVDLGTLGGRDSFAVDINNAGQVIGYSYMPDGNIHAFLWTEADGMQDLGTLGGSFSSAGDINDQGQILGSATDASGVSHPVMWEDGVIRELNLEAPGRASGEFINELGHIAGDLLVSGNQAHAFFWSPEAGVIDLGTLGYLTSSPSGINDHDVVVGSSTIGISEYRAFRWADGVMIDIGTLEGGQTRAWAINNNGRIIGSSQTSTGPGAFYWSESCGLRPLAYGYYSSSARAINDDGIVTGYVVPEPGNGRAAAWLPLGGCSYNSPTTLQGLGGDDDLAIAINAKGNIAGNSFTSRGEQHAALWRKVCDFDRVCEEGEDCNTCPYDCISGGKGKSAYCCGDATCSTGEDLLSCSLDCSLCGNGLCDPGEDPCSCSQDCGLQQNPETSCSDGIDNDCDGLIDGSDSTDCPPPPDVVASADHQTGPGEIIEGSYISTHVADEDAREVLRETKRGRKSLLTHVWRFDNVPSGTSHILNVRASRLANNEGDNFQFAYSTDGGNYTDILGAEINKPFEPLSGLEFSFGPAGLSGTIYIRVQDTVGNGTELDTISVDRLLIKTVP